MNVHAVRTIFGFADNFQMRLNFNQVSQPSAKNWMVIGDKDFDFFSVHPSPRAMG